MTRPRPVQVLIQPVKLTQNTTFIGLAGLIQSIIISYNNSNKNNNNVIEQF